MELECSLVRPDSDPVSTVRRLHPDILIVDLDLPDLRALEIARAARAVQPELPVIYLTGHEAFATGDPVLRKPNGCFEEMLHLFEVMLREADRRSR
jgi:DNA-binding response OmpR family regulator